MRAVLASLVFFAFAQALDAATIRVPVDQPTIQSGLDAATKGDTVLVASGFYSGPGNRALAFRGKDLVLRSEGGAAVTTIEAQHEMGIVFGGGETNAAVVDGFTILHANGFPGAAFAFWYCSPTIRNCRVRDCDMSGTIESHPIFLDCTFEDGVSGQEGGALTVKFASSMRIERCTFILNRCHSINRGGAIHVAWGCTATIVDCVMLGNAAEWGGAIYVASGASASVVGCTISDNCGTGRGGGLFVDGTLTIDRSIVAFNHEFTSGSGVGTIVATCTDVFGNEGGDWVDGLAGQLGQAGNVSLDPEFCDRQPPLVPCYVPGGHDYGRLTLRATSPCAPDHSGGCGLIGALPVECGPVAVEERTWGGIKARFSSPR